MDLMLTDIRAQIDKEETTENDAQDTAQAAIELVRNMARMDNAGLESAIELATDDMIKASEEVEQARMWREMCSMRLTVMEHELLRRLINERCSE